MIRMPCLALALTVLSASAVEPRPAALVGFTNELAVLEFDSAGCLSRLVDRENGRDLLASSAAATAIRTMEGLTVDAESLVIRQGRLVFAYPGFSGEAILSVRTESWGFAFKIEKFDVKGKVGIRDFISLRVRPHADFRGHYGSMLSGCTDARTGLVLRSYDIVTAMRMKTDDSLWTIVEDRRPAVGQQMALVVAPRARLTSCLQAMTLDSGCFHTKCGGAWSLNAPENRRSYLFARVEPRTLDDWISLAERGGFSMVHLSGWWKALGHYDPDSRLFPNGREDLKRCVDRLRAAGFAVSSHTLCSGIAFSDPWITPECNPEVLALYTYTLTEPLAADDTQLTVKERPGRRHDLVTTYFSNGNILRIGTELMTYEGLSTEPPYVFTGLKRGAYGTRNTGPVPAGTKVDYVFQHFGTLFPDMAKPFGTEMAKHLCGLFNYYGFDMMYQDGAEPFLRYQTDLNRLNFVKHLDMSRRPVQIEASTWNTSSWWFHSTAGATDHPVWAPKRFHDHHLKTVIGTIRENDLLAGQMGWWAPRGPCDFAEGHYADDMEYFAAKNAANDLAMSVQGVNAGMNVPFNQEAMMTILGWYERARMARVFTPAALEILRRNRQETLLRQADDGEWRLAPVTCLKHRVASTDFRTWEVRAPMGRASVRVKALFGAQPYDSVQGRSLIGPDDIPAMKLTVAEGVRQTMSEGAAGEHGKTLKIEATNSRRASKGAWTQVSLEYRLPFRDASVRCRDGGGAFGFWLKGDGSGVVLNLQLRTPRIYIGGWSDHVVKVDFTGWRYVQLFVRERDAELYDDFMWPYPRQIYSIYRQKLDLKRLEQVNLFLNEIPAGGRTSIEISQVRVLPTENVPVEGAEVAVNGVNMRIPFAMASGEWAELDERGWIHYSVRGEPVERKAAPPMPVLSAGVNGCSFFSSNAKHRAEVQFFVRESAVPAFTEDVARTRETAYEAMLPQIYDPAHGFAELTPIVARANETARLELEVLGPVSAPGIVPADGRKVSFPVDVAVKERLLCPDGQNWRVENSRGEVIRSGCLESPLVILGGERARFVAGPSSSAKVKIVKRYQR